MYKLKTSYIEGIKRSTSKALKAHCKEELREEFAVKGSITKEAAYTRRRASCKLSKRGIFVWLSYPNLSLIHVSMMLMAIKYGLCVIP